MNFLNSYFLIKYFFFWKQFYHLSKYCQIEIRVLHMQFWGFPGGTMAKNLPANAESKRCMFNPWVRKIPWNSKWQLTPIFFAWKIPWTEEPGRLQSMSLQRVRHNWGTKHSTFDIYRIHTLDSKGHVFWKWEDGKCISHKLTIRQMVY